MATLRLEFGGQVPGLRQPALAVAGAAGDVGARAGHLVPEEVGHVVEAQSPEISYRRAAADHLRDMRIHVQPAQFVAPQRQRD